MSMSLLWRCLLVSALISALGPAFTMTMAVPSDEDLIDISKITEQELEEVSSPEELDALLEEKADYHRRVSGIVERFSYVMGHPQIRWYYFHTAISLFCLVLPATLVASFWNIRATRQV